MAALASISWSCSSPMSWHRSTKVGFLGVLWSPGPGSTSPPSADDPIWGGYPGVIKWGSRDRSPAVRGDCQWGAFLGYDQGCIDSWGHLWKQYLPYWRSVPPHGLLLATPPTTSPCPLPGHDPASNGPSAVPLPLRTATVCLILPCRRRSCTWWARGGISFKCD